MKSKKKSKTVQESVTFAIDDRVYDQLPKDCRYIVGYVAKDTDPPNNIAFFYRKEDDSFYIRAGPYQTGHWGHDSSGDIIPRARFLSEEYWKALRFPNAVVRRIHEFLLKEGFVEKPPPYTKDSWLSSRTVR